MKRRAEAPAPVAVRPQELPEELAIERALLGTLILHPRETLDRVRGIVSPADFSAPFHEAVFSVAISLDDAGRPAEWFAVWDELVARGLEPKLRAVGGIDYGIVLSEAASITGAATYAAERIAAAAHARRIGYAATEIAARARARDRDPVAFAAEARLLFEQAAGANPAAAWPGWRELAHAVGYQGPRLQTGIPALDEGTGGLPAGRKIFVGGAPGAGKTALVVQLLHRWAHQGVLVGMLAVDQPAAAVLCRWGQLDGIDRGLLECGDPDARRELAERQPQPAPLIVDGSRGGITIQAVSAELRRRREALRLPVSVLAIDSLHTAESGAPDDADQRQRVESAVHAVKRAAERDGHLVLVTSELVKGSYRSKASAEQTDDRAAFAESRAIGHESDLSLVLRTPDDGSRIDVAIPKSRIHPDHPQPFALRLDRSRSALEQIERGEDEDPEEVRRTAALAAAKHKILRVIAASPQPLVSKNAIHQRVRGNKSTVFAAVRELAEDDGAIVLTSRGYLLAAQAAAEQA